MRTERQDRFAELEGQLMKYVSTSDPAFTTLKELETKVGNMTSEQITLIGQLIERIVRARNQSIKRKIAAEIEALEL